MEKPSKLKKLTTVQPPTRKLGRKISSPKLPGTTGKPRIQRLCTLSGIPAKNPIPHGSVSIPPQSLVIPDVNVASQNSKEMVRKESWDSILATKMKSTPKQPTTNFIPPLQLTPASAQTPDAPYNSAAINHEQYQASLASGNIINFHNFDPIRTLQFLTLELKSRVKHHLPEEKNLHRIVAEIQQTIKRLSSVQTSTGIETAILTDGGAGGERRIIHNGYHQSNVSGDSISEHLQFSLNTRKRLKNQISQTESVHLLAVPPPPPPPRKPQLFTRGINTESRSTTTVNDTELEVSHGKLQQEVSKYHDEVMSLQKKQLKLQSSLKSRDQQINQLQKELRDIQNLMKEQINLMSSEHIFIDLKSGKSGKSQNGQKSYNNQTNLSSSVSLTNIPSPAIINQKQNNQHLEPPIKHDPYREQETSSRTPHHIKTLYENQYFKHQKNVRGAHQPQQLGTDYNDGSGDDKLKSPPTLITPHVSLSMDNYLKESNKRWIASNDGGNHNKGGFDDNNNHRRHKYGVHDHDDDYDVDNNDGVVMRSKKKAPPLCLDATKNLKEINLNMDEIKAIFNDVKLPSPPRKFHQELPSFL